MREEVARLIDMILAISRQRAKGNDNDRKRIADTKPIRTQRSEAKTKRAYDEKLVDLLQEVEDLAIAGWDGHLALMRFTGGWKIIFGTPDLDLEGREKIWRLKSYPSLQEALEAGLMERPDARMHIDLDDSLFGEGFEP